MAKTCNWAMASSLLLIACALMAGVQADTFTRPACTLACDGQSTASSACWQCVLYDPVTYLLQLDFTNCAFTSVGCVGCQTSTSSSGRRLLDTLTSGGGTTTVQGTSGGTTKNPSTGRRLQPITASADIGRRSFITARRLLDDDEDCNPEDPVTLSDGSVWRKCATTSATCSITGVFPGCNKDADYRVCEFKVQNGLSSVCPIAECSMQGFNLANILNGLSLGPACDKGCRCPDKLCCDGSRCVPPVISQCSQSNADGSTSWCTTRKKCVCPPQTSILGLVSLGPATCVP